MTSLEFSECSMEYKAEVLMKVGTFLYSFNYYVYRADLYSLGNLFVESKLDTISNDIREINIITEKDMEKYVNRIRLGL